MNNPTCPLCPPHDRQPAALIVGSRRKGNGWEAYTGYVCENHDLLYRQLMQIVIVCPMCEGQMKAIGEIFVIGSNVKVWLKCANGHYKVNAQEVREYGH